MTWPSSCFVKRLYAGAAFRTTINRIKFPCLGRCHWDTFACPSGLPNAYHCHMTINISLLFSSLPPLLIALLFLRNEMLYITRHSSVCVCLYIYYNCWIKRGPRGVEILLYLLLHLIKFHLSCGPLLMWAIDVSHRHPCGYEPANICVFESESNIWHDHDFKGMLLQILSVLWNTLL